MATKEEVKSKIKEKMQEETEISEQDVNAYLNMAEDLILDISEQLQRGISMSGMGDDELRRIQSMVEELRKYIRNSQNVIR